MYLKDGLLLYGGYRQSAAFLHTVCLSDRTHSNVSLRLYQTSYSNRPQEFSAAFGNLPVFLGSCCSSFIVGAQNIPILWGERYPGCAAPWWWHPRRHIISSHLSGLNEDDLCEDKSPADTAALQLQRSSSVKQTGTSPLQYTGLFKIKAAQRLTWYALEVSVSGRVRNDWNYVLQNP